MASIGHVAIGMAAARVRGDRRAAGWRSMTAWSAISMLPDADVIGFAMGVAYGDPWGHRGATHSFAFALAAGLAIALVASWFGRPAVRTGRFATLVLASHPVLDTFTDGGLGCALFWPFDLTRYFAPWRPIPVSPIGLDYLTSYGLMVFVVELILFSPIFLFALWPRHRRPIGRPALATLGIVWLAGAWLIASTDPVRERVMGMVLREETVLARGFSEPAFAAVTRGQSKEMVRKALGEPLQQFWFYGSGEKSAFEISAADLPPACVSVGFRDAVVSRAFDPDQCKKIGIAVGTPIADVVRILGGCPSDECWMFGWSPGGRYYRQRDVCFFKGLATEKFRRWAREPN
jgi:inner membrane protein